MKKFNWKEFIRTHPLFSSLNQMEIEEFLKEGLSEEKEFPQGTLIVREGEFSDTIFLIGSGSVQVVLSEKGGNETSLSTLRRGEIFGEMAVLDKRPRSATVKANENCTLLEVKGQEFMKILGDHPDIEFKILLKLSERLRVLNDHLLTIKVQDVDEKLKLFNSKLDAELKAVEASLKAAQVVFDQTTARANDVINSAERSRTRVNVAFTTITTIISAGLAAGGWLGFSTYQTIDQALTQANQKLTQVNDTLKQTNEAQKQASGHLASIEKAKAAAEQVDRSLSNTTGLLADIIFMASFKDALRRNSQFDAVEIYKGIRDLKGKNDPQFISDMLTRIQVSISDNSKRDFRDFTGLLGTILQDAQNPEEIIKCRYLLLTNAILVMKDVKPNPLLTHGETYNKTFEGLQKYMEEHKEKRINKDDLFPQELFEQDNRKQEAYDRVRKVVLRP